MTITNEVQLAIMEKAQTHVNQLVTQYRKHKEKK